MTKIKFPIDCHKLVKEVELNLIKQALERSGGVKAAAARLLGVSRSTFTVMLKRHGLFWLKPKKETELRELKKTEYEKCKWEPTE